jgi:hypothetical protein
MEGEKGSRIKKRFENTFAAGIMNLKGENSRKSGRRETSHLRFAVISLE